MYKNVGEKLSKYDCNNICNRKLKKEFSWLKEPDKFALTNAIYDLDNAYIRFFKKINQSGFPKFKSKKINKKSYKTTQNNGNKAIKLLNNKIKLPKLGLVKCKVSKQIEGRILNATISQIPSGKYFVSICCTDVEIPKLNKTSALVGIDLGIKEFAITSDGKHIENPKWLSKSEKKLIKLQKDLSRKSIGSNNRNKARIKVARQYEKVSNQRKDFLHKLSTNIVKDYDVICIEDLKVKNMVRNHKFAKSISDVSWSEFVRQLQYKADWYGKIIQKVDTYFASSQLCNVCGYKNEEVKDLDVREWTCPECGTWHDRDYNASKNILDEGIRILKII